MEIEILLFLIKIILVTFASIFIGLIYKGIDRKLTAKLQGRIGPPITQPIRDIKKLMIKENIVPKDAIPWIFNSIPIFSLAITISIFFYIPFLGFEPILSSYGDFILVLYLLTIPSLGLVIGGFSSGSPYATVGAQREMVMMLSYEFPLVVTCIAVATLISANNPNLNAFSIQDISNFSVLNSVSIVGFLGLIFLFSSIFFVLPAEVSKIPFDVAEAETEIAGGLLAEYSGRNLAFFYLTDSVKTIAILSIIVAIFFPYNISNFFSISLIPDFVLNLLFYLIKIFILMLLSITLIKVSVARLKIDQIVYLYLFPIAIISLIGLILVIIDTKI
ncbi:MAG: complex I subunit 1 family protein [Candidatus Altiarchaeota archaeon]